MLGRGVAVLVRDHQAWVGGVLALIITAACGAAWAGLAPGTFHASQKGQAFQPGELTIPRGSTIEIVNDDGDILHHAYVESSAFSFDSGDQEPGTTVAIKFPVTGSFNVLCGIHPKMKLRVRVE